MLRRMCLSHVAMTNSTLQHRARTIPTWLEATAREWTPFYQAWCASTTCFDPALKWWLKWWLTTPTHRYTFLAMTTPRPTTHCLHVSIHLSISVPIDCNRMTGPVRCLDPWKEGRSSRKTGSMTQQQLRGTTRYSQWFVIKTKLHISWILRSYDHYFQFQKEIIFAVYRLT